VTHLGHWRGDKCTYKNLTLKAVKWSETESENRPLNVNAPQRGAIMQCLIKETDLYSQIQSQKCLDALKAILMWERGFVL